MYSAILEENASSYWHEQALGGNNPSALDFLTIDEGDPGYSVKSYLNQANFTLPGGGVLTYDNDNETGYVDCISAPYHTVNLQVLRSTISLSDYEMDVMNKIIDGESDWRCGSFIYSSHAFYFVLGNRLEV